MDNDYNKMREMQIFEEYRPESVGRLYDRSVSVILNVKGMGSAAIEAMVGHQQDEEKMVFLFGYALDGAEDQVKALAIDLRQDLVVQTMKLSRKNKDRLFCRFLGA